LQNQADNKSRYQRKVKYLSSPFCPGTGGGSPKKDFRFFSCRREERKQDEMRQDKLKCAKRFQIQINNGINKQKIYELNFDKSKIRKKIHKIIQKFSAIGLQLVRLWYNGRK
jgi:hypothetical protein